MKPRLLLLFFVACAPPVVTPTIEVQHAQAPVVVAPTPPRPADPLGEWHWRKPKPAKDKSEDGKPLYLAVHSERGVMAGGCHVERSTGGKAYVLCERDIGRVEGSKVDFAWGTKLPLRDFEPTGVIEDGDRLWVTTESAGDGAYDPFFDSAFAILLQREGKWERFETQSKPTTYCGGKILFTALPARADSACPDASCSGILPKFETFGAKEKPDFSALAGKFAWIHASSLAGDFNVTIDPEGPVYVLMRALDLGTQKRGFGVASWTPKGGAKLDWLPGALGSSTDAWSSAASAADGKAMFDLTVQSPQGRKQYFLRYDGKSWSTTTTPPPAQPMGDSPIYPDPYARIVTTFDDDTWIDEAGMLYRTSPTDEVFVQTERWGRVHPFAPPADDECTTPFAVLDRMEKDRLTDTIAKADDSWGVVEEKHASQLVKMETEELVVIGVPFGTTSDAQAFLDRTPWTNFRDGTVTPHVVVCARPVAPTPLSLPKK